MPEVEESPRRRVRDRKKKCHPRKQKKEKVQRSQIFQYGTARSTAGRMGNSKSQKEGAG